MRNYRCTLGIILSIFLTACGGGGGGGSSSNGGSSSDGGGGGGGGGGTTPGSLYTSFGTGGKTITPIGNHFDIARAVAIQSDGKIVVAGYAEDDFVIPSNNIALARYNADGSLDTSFSSDGKLITSVCCSFSKAYAIAIQSDGKIVVAGEAYNGIDTDFTLVRYNTDGSFDTSFDGDGKVTTAIGSYFDAAYSLAIQSDGKIVVAGEASDGKSYDIALARYNTNGSLDSSFGTGGKVVTVIGSGWDSANAIALQSDGKIVVAGKSYNGTADTFALVRYNADGSLDTTFDTDGIVTTLLSVSDIANAIAIQSDGKIVVAGQSYNGTATDYALARYNTDGSLDTSFNTDGKVVTDMGGSWDVANAIVIQSDGKIVVAGEAPPPGSVLDDFGLARYNANGSLDTTFDSDGKVFTEMGSDFDIAYAIALQSDGKMVVAGKSYGATSDDFALAVYWP